MQRLLEEIAASDELLAADEPAGDQEAGVVRLLADEGGPLVGERL